MTKATDLSDAIETNLAMITPANGYATAITAVYGFGLAKKDTAPLPCLLVRVGEDTAEQPVGNTCKRHAQYEIEGIFPRSASLQDLQRCHHDILRALGYGSQLPARALRAGTIVEEVAEFDPEPESDKRRLVSTITIRYVETY